MSFGFDRTEVLTEYPLRKQLVLNECEQQMLEKMELF